jgi:hypothetical protein
VLTEQEETTMRIFPPHTTATVGRSVSVSVIVEDLYHAGEVGYDDNRDTVVDRTVPSRGLGAFEFVFGYDAQIVEVEDIVPDLASLEASGRSFRCFQLRIEPGEIRFACASDGPRPDGVQGDMTLATIVLRPRHTGSGWLRLDMVGLSGPLGDEIPARAVGGTLLVSGSGATLVPSDGGPASEGSASQDGTGATDSGNSGETFQAGETGTDATPEEGVSSSVPTVEAQDGRVHIAGHDELGDVAVREGVVPDGLNRGPEDAQRVRAGTDASTQTATWALWALLGLGAGLALVLAAGVAYRLWRTSVGEQQ